MRSNLRLADPIDIGAPEPHTPQVRLLELERRVVVFFDEYYDKERTPQVLRTLRSFQEQLRCFHRDHAFAELNFDPLFILDKIDALIGMMYEAPLAPASAPEPEKSAAEKDLALLRERGYYAVGLPHRINRLQEPYNRTLDIVILVETLMRREGDPACLLVANINTETRDSEESRLIGLKDLIFYEALQDLLFEMAGPEEAKQLQRLPVVLLSDLETLPGFAEKRVAVEELFNGTEAVNKTFREAVYACVPRQLRHRKHHDESYAQLEALANQAPLKVAQGRVRYVLDQISKVLSIGGKKRGHEDEKPYDEATALAARLLPPDASDTSVEFECISVPKSLGKIPYRAAAGLKDSREVPGLLSTYGHLENYSEALHAFVNLRRKPLDQVNNLLREAELALEEAKKETPPNPDRLDYAEGWRAKLLETIRIMVHQFALNVVDEHKRLREPIAILEEFTMSLRNKFLQQLQRHPKVQGEDFRLIEDAFMLQHQKECFLSKASGPNVLDYVLLKRTGILKVLEEDAPLATLAETSGRWIPFTVEPSTFHISFSYVPFVVSALMFGPNAPHSNQANYADMSEMVEATGRWKVPYRIFEKGLFADVKPPELAKTSADVADTLNRLLVSPKSSRWKVFDTFLDAIEGTPVEGFYKLWLSRPEGLPVSNPSPLPPEFVRSAEAERIKGLLAHTCFSEHFRKDFLFILEGH